MKKNIGKRVNYNFMTIEINNYSEYTLIMFSSVKGSFGTNTNKSL